jgi:hypothetical protein
MGGYSNVSCVKNADTPGRSDPRRTWTGGSTAPSAHCGKRETDTGTAHSQREFVIRFVTVTLLVFGHRLRFRSAKVWSLDRCMLHCTLARVVLVATPSAHANAV